MRKGFDGLSAQVRNILQLDPFSGAVFLFRGKRGDRLKALVWDGSGLCLYAKRLERRKFVWPRTQDGGAARLSAAQLAMLRSEEHTSELQSLMRLSYAVFCLKKTKPTSQQRVYNTRDKKNI